MQGKELSVADSAALISKLEARFDANKRCRQTLEWHEIANRLKAEPAKLWTIAQMEFTGGEPEVIEFDATDGKFVFYDCSPESPGGRRSLCYDPNALDARKESKPVSSAIEVAAQMGIELLTESQYRHLQAFGNFDSKTSSWLLTPPEIRNLGGAIFADFRYGQTFVYHNGASSYYAARGFRGLCRI